MTSMAARGDVDLFMYFCVALVTFDGACCVVHSTSWPSSHHARSTRNTRCNREMEIDSKEFYYVHVDFDTSIHKC